MALTGHSLNWGVPWIDHEQIVVALSRRTVGYPLLLLATGVPEFQTFSVILLVQAAMAVTIPVLVYKIIQPFSAISAFWTSLILIITLEPFNYSKVISSDHTYKFLLILIMYIITLAYRKPSWSLYFYIALACLMLALVRPEGSLVIIIIAAMLLSANSGRWKGVLLSFAVSCLAICMVSLSISLYVIPDVPTELDNVTAGRLKNDFMSRIETLLFYNIYAPRDNILTEADYFQQSDPRAELRMVLINYAEEFPNEWQALLPRHYFGIFSGNYASWVDKIYWDPNPFYLTIIRLAVKMAEQSPDPRIRIAGNHLIRRINFQIYLSNPKYIISFIQRYLMSSSLNTAGQDIFLEKYTHLPSGSFKESDGPASNEIITLTRLYAEEFPSYLPPQWRYPNSESELITAIEGRDQSEKLIGTLCGGAVDRFRGKFETSSLFYRAAQKYSDDSIWQRAESVR